MGPNPVISLRPAGEIFESTNLVTLSMIQKISNEEYLVTGVPPGRHTLSVTTRGSPSWSNGTLTLPVARGLLEVQVTDGDVDAGIVLFKPAVTIPVRISFAGGTPGDVNVLAFPLSGTGIANRLTPLDPPPGLGLRDVAEGSYGLDFQLPPDHYVLLARYGGRDVFSNPLVVDGASAGSLEVVVDRAGGRVQGILRDLRGEPVPNAAVVLVPPIYQRGNPFRFRTTNTDGTGGFRFEGVPPAVYSVLAWDSVQGYAYRDPKWLAEFETQGTSVTVERGTTSIVNARIIPAYR
jgi:hypothetical protein